DGQIWHFHDNGSAIEDVGGGLPFWAGVLAVNPANGKFAAAHGENKATGLNIPRQNAFPDECAPNNGFCGPAWMFTRSTSGIDTGTWDAGNNGTGIEYIKDLEVGPDGTIFATSGPKISSTSGWIMAWKDRGPSQTPQLLSGVGNSSSNAWVGVG